MSGDTGFRLYNGGGVAEWAIHQHAHGTDDKLTFSTVVFTTFSDKMSLDTSGNLALAGGLYTVNGLALTLGQDTNVAHANTVYSNVHSTNGGDVAFNIMSNNDTKGAFGYLAAQNKTYLVAYANGGNYSQLHLAGSTITADNDFVANGLVNINASTPTLNWQISGSNKMQAGHNGSNGFISSMTGVLCLTGQTVSDTGIALYGGNVKVYGGYHIIPESYEGGYCGNSSHRWYGGYIRTVYTLGGGQYDMYDDLAIAKLWGETNPALPSSYDPQKTKPQGKPFDFLKAKKENGEPDEYFNLNELVSFVMCCTKASAKKHDEHDARFEALLREVEDLRSQIQQLKQTRNN